ncbi:MAG: LytR/AlgR family response regulator transcription factor [Pyrinomonadaceae bacterium]
MKVRTLIVDDMPLARRRVAALLAPDSEIEVVGECGNGAEAVASIAEAAPDLVFLDVQMPEVGGFDVIKTVGAERMPVVIFVTAYDEFALQAFEAAALDYLLKPFDEERLAAAVGRAKREVERRRTGAADARLRGLIERVAARQRQYTARLAVKTGGRAIILQIEDIDWIGAAGNYVELHAGRETHLLREKIGELEGKLDPEKFVRVHRSTIVNIERVNHLCPLSNDDYEIVLRDGTRLTSSRTYNERLMSALRGGL